MFMKLDTRGAGDQMATKTITIDLWAYKRLKGMQRDKESLSQTINRVVRPPLDADRILRKVKSLSPEAAIAIERQVRSRAIRSRRDL